jgi:hypothetical protein
MAPQICTRKWADRNNRQSSGARIFDGPPHQLPAIAAPLICLRHLSVYEHEAVFTQLVDQKRHTLIRMQFEATVRLVVHNIQDSLPRVSRGSDRHLRNARSIPTTPGGG